MATWRDIASTEDAVDSPLTAQLGQAWTDNVIAALEMADNAPYMQTSWHPYDASYEGVSEGVLYDHASDGTVSQIDTPVFEQNHEYAFLFDGLSGTVLSDLTVSANRSTGGWSTPVTILGVTGSSEFISGGPLYAVRPTIAAQIFVLRTDAPVFEGPTNFYSVFDDTLTTSSDFRTITQLRLAFSTGDIDAGRVILLKRKHYV